jgi:CheY-like chemotaxis protein
MAGVTERESTGLAGVKLLVVDDDFRNIFAMTALLERAHADVTVLESGPDAISSLENGLPISTSS